MARREKLPLPAMLDPTFKGPIYRFDIDRTYLKTHFDSFWALLKTYFEKPKSKKTLPGMAALIKEIRRGNGEHVHKCPIFFVSASPTQMRKKIEFKMRLDGVEQDGITFKNQLRHLRRGEFKRLRHHMGYKVIALLKGRTSFPQGATEILFGDDVENDATIYALYGDICAHRLSGTKLSSLLSRLGVHHEEIAEIMSLQKTMNPMDPIEKIYIHLEGGSDPSYYKKYGTKMIPTHNAFQAALSLFESGHLSMSGLLKVAEDFREQSSQKIWLYLMDLFERGALKIKTIQEIKPLFQEKSLFPHDVSLGWSDLFLRLKQLWNPVTQVEKEVLSDPLLKYVDEFSH